MWWLMRTVQYPSLELLSWFKKMLRWYVVIFCRLYKRSETVLSVSRSITDYSHFLRDIHVWHWWSSKQVRRRTKTEPTFAWDDPVPSSFIHWLWLAKRSRTVQRKRQNFFSASQQHAPKQIIHPEYEVSRFLRNVATIICYTVRKP